MNEYQSLEKEGQRLRCVSLSPALSGGTELGLEANAGYQMRAPGENGNLLIYLPPHQRDHNFVKKKSHTCAPRNKTD